MNMSKPVSSNNLVGRTFEIRHIVERVSLFQEPDSEEAKLYTSTTAIDVSTGEELLINGGGEQYNAGLLKMRSLFGFPFIGTLKSVTSKGGYEMLYWQFSRAAKKGQSRVAVPTLSSATNTRLIATISAFTTRQKDTDRTTTMIIKGAFPISNDEIDTLYERMLTVDVADLNNGGGPLEIKCRLLTDSWEDYCSACTETTWREKPKLTAGILGYTNGIVGTGDVWIRPHMSRETFIRVFAHEISHLIANALIQFDEYGLPIIACERSHDLVFEEVNNRICDAIGAPKTPKAQFERWRAID